MKDSHNNIKEPKRAFVEFVRYFSFIISKIFWRIEFINTENIPNNLASGLIIAPNHQTYFDPFWVCNPIKKDMRYMAWDKAFEMFLIGGLLRRIGAFPVSLERGGTIRALKDSLKFLRKGKTLLIFPEGEREFADGKLLPFKTGAIRIAIEANVPILPVTVRGGNRVWSRDHKFPRPRKIQIIYHPLFEISKASENKTSEALNNELKQIIASEL